MTHGVIYSSQRDVSIITLLSFADAESFFFFLFQMTQKFCPNQLVRKKIALLRRRAPQRKQGQNILVCDTLANNRWLRGLERLTIECELQRFLLNLWEQIQAMNLSQLPDSVTWMPTAGGSYYAKFGYERQFIAEMTNAVCVH
jgi:hypothetical protein